MAAPFFGRVAQRLIVAVDEEPPGGLEALAHLLDSLPDGVETLCLGAGLLAQGGVERVRTLGQRRWRYMLDGSMVSALEGLHPGTPPAGLTLGVPSGVQREGTPLESRLVGTPPADWKGDLLQPLITLSLWEGATALQSRGVQLRARVLAMGWPEPLLLGTTLPTSLGDAELAWLLDGDAGVNASSERHRREALMARLAARCCEAGFDGLVTAGPDLAAVRSAVPPGFLLVVAGVRPRGSDPAEHALCVTPIRALQAGASMLVVGRPVTAAPCAREAAQTILREMEEAYLIA